MALPQQSVLDAIPGYAIWISKDLTYLMVNQTILDLVGKPQSFFVGQPIGFMQTERGGVLLGFVRSFFASSEMTRVIEAEMGLPRPDSWSLISMKKVNGGQEAILVAIDITERRRIERDLENERLKQVISSKMASLGEMAGGIAHEINNPLAIILGLANQLRLLAQQGEVIDAARLVQVTQKIEDTAARIGRIVRGLRLFSRDGMNDPFEKVLLAQMIEDTLELCRPRFVLHGVELVYPQLPALGITVECRGVQISQVLLNLLNNAFDAVSDAPVKRIGLEVRDLDKEDSIEIRVWDSGPGVPLEFREKIFDPFFTTKSAGKGTGLGLSISKGIIASHHGQISVEGSCFVVRLPKNRGESKTEISS